MTMTERNIIRIHERIREIECELARMPGGEQGTRFHLELVGNLSAMRAAVQRQEAVRE